MMVKLAPFSLIHNRLLFIAFFVCLLVPATRAQPALPGASTDKVKQVPPALFDHYTPAELLDIQTSDTLKYQTLVYYYGQSFIVEPINCSDCILTELNHFDVSKYEHLRQKSERYTRTFDKYGFRLTLLAIDELTYKLPIHLRH